MLATLALVEEILMYDIKYKKAFKKNLNLLVSTDHDTALSTNVTGESPQELGLKLYC